MNITIVTPFRDEAGRLDAYFARLLSLDWPHDQLRYVFVEGDSTDNTFMRLATFLDVDRRGRLIRCDTGRPRYPSIVHPDRFRVLARVFNAGLDAVDLDWTDRVLFLPCDIRYGPDLLQRLAAHNLDAVAPFVFQGNIFYDIWAFSHEGNFLANFPREALSIWGTEPVEMTTIGGTMLFDVALLLAGVRYTYEEVDRGWSHAARAAGFRLWADPLTIVEHGG